METSQGESQDDSMEDLIKDGSPMEADFPYPIAAFHPEIGLIQIDSLECFLVPGTECVSAKDTCVDQQSQVLS